MVRLDYLGVPSHIVPGGPTKARKEKKILALDEKPERVQNLADKLQAKDGDTFNRIQYKLWAEPLNVKKHDSMDRPLFSSSSEPDKSITIDLD